MRVDEHTPHIRDEHAASSESTKCVSHVEGDVDVAGENRAGWRLQWGDGWCHTVGEARRDNGCHDIFMVSQL